MGLTIKDFTFFSGNVEKDITTEYRHSNHLHPVDEHGIWFGNKVRAEMMSGGGHLRHRAFCTFPSLTLTVGHKGDEMSMYKQNGQWRGNQPGSTSQYFNCLLGDILASRRGWSQTKLARLLNVSTTSVNSWVKGTAMPPDDTQEMIAHILGYENRAEIWVYKNGTKILPLVLRMNKLTVELDETENRIRHELGNGHHATIDTSRQEKYNENVCRKTMT